MVTTEQVRTRTADSTGGIEWEVFERVYTRSEGAPVVTISKSGVLGFNRMAYEAIGSPLRIVFLMNRARHLLAFRSSDDASAPSYKSALGKSGSVTVSGVGVLRYLGLGKLTQRIRCPLQRAADGTYFIDLSPAFGEDSNGNG